jgi:hypothetical protein
MKRPKEQLQDNLAHLLIQGGCPVQIDTGFRVPPSGLLIEQVPEVGLNMIFDLANGGTGFLLDIHIKNERHDPVWLDGFQIEDAWGRVTKSLVAAPSKSDMKYPYYSYPDSTLAFDGEIVVNRFFTTRRRLIRKDEICGLLMALSTDSIPNEVEQNARVVVTFSVFDRRGTPFSKNFLLAVDRTERMIQERKKQAQIAARDRKPPRGGGCTATRQAIETHR